MVIYKIFTLAVSSNFLFTTTLDFLDDKSLEPDIRFTVSHSFSDFGGISNYEKMCFSSGANFYISHNSILGHLLNPSDIPLLEIQFLGSVLAFWMETQSLLTLHASSVCLENKAIAFLGSNQSGKSSLAATFMTVGLPLITDDLLVLENVEGSFYCRPSFPSMKMWPDQAHHFLGKDLDLSNVHPKVSKKRIPVGPNGFGLFCGSTQKIHRIYLPERRDPQEWGEGIKFTSLSPRDALIALVRNSFLTNILEKRGLQAGRLSVLANIVQAVPAYKIIYPAGYQFLPHVRDAVFAHILQ